MYVTKQCYGHTRRHAYLAMSYVPVRTAKAVQTSLGMYDDEHDHIHRGRRLHDLQKNSYTDSCAPLLWLDDGKCPATAGNIEHLKKSTFVQILEIGFAVILFHKNPTPRYFFKEASCNFLSFFYFCLQTLQNLLICILCRRQALGDSKHFNGCRLEEDCE